MAMQADDAKLAADTQTPQRDFRATDPEIIVTARKRDELLRDVPMAIRVIDDQMIEREGIRTVEDLSRRLPGLTFDQGGFPADTRPAIRGMQSERGRPSIAILLDGLNLSGENMVIGGGGAAVNTLHYDLERIEVVKGPQSVLLAPNTRLPVPDGGFAPAPGAPSVRPCPASLSGLTPPQILNCTRGPFVDNVSARADQIDLSPDPFTGQHRCLPARGRAGFGSRHPADDGAISLLR